MKNLSLVKWLIMLVTLPAYSQTWNVPPLYPSSGYDNTYIGTTAGDFNVRVGGVTIMKFNKTSSTDTRIGISTTTPLEKLHVNGGALRLTGAIAVANPADAFSNGAVRLGNNGTASSWIQSYATNSTYSPLILNPLGGSVAIGTSSPATLLEISKLGGDQIIKLTRTSDGTMPTLFGSSGIQFSDGASIIQKTMADYGSGTLTISSSGAMIQMYNGSIYFGGNPGPGTLTGLNSGVFGFNNLVWAKTLLVSDYTINDGQSGIQNVPTGYKLAVNGKTNLLSNVLIGVNGTGFTTGYKLDVQSTDQSVVRFMNSTGSAVVRIQNSTSEAWGVVTSGTGNTLGVPSGSLYMESIGSGAKMVISKSGSVGIGVITPSEKLHVVGNVKVEGKIAAVEICANTTSSWCDYVFEPNYDLPKLAQVQAFISQHKHLPDVPSEADVKANGYNLTRMDAILLKKLEEAYLYILDLEARMKGLEAKK